MTRVSVPAPVPGVTNYGAWSLFKHEYNGLEYYGARLMPDHAPWRDLFTALDDVGSSLSPEPVTPREEAEAIVACCWRYGTYVHVLSGGESYPPFRSNPELGRISDSEMMRINLEFSSGFASWMEDRAADPARIYRRVRAASTCLSIPWRNECEYEDPEIGKSVFGTMLRERLREHPELLDRPIPTLRREANLAVVWAYRNGPIENLHAGMDSRGEHLPGYQRLYASEAKRIGHLAAKRLSFHLAARAQLGDGYLRVALPALAMFGASGWSLTEETSPVVFLSPPESGPLDERLRQLVARCPTIYNLPAPLIASYRPGFTTP